MDFGSGYVLEEGEEEEFLESSSTSGGYQGDVSLPLPDVVGFECEIMGFEEEQENQLPPERKRNGGTSKINTNTIQLTMNSLKEDPDDILKMTSLKRCGNKKCTAVFSHLDADVVRKEEKVWSCKFCSLQNPLESSNIVTIPKEDILYTPDPKNPPKMDIRKEESKIIFAIDSSASMREVLEVDENRMNETLKNIVKSEQRDPSEVKTRVTRLQCVKAAVIDELQRMKNDPHLSKKRVGLITFCDHVIVYGDGQSECKLVEGSALASNRELLQIGHSNATLDHICNSADSLIDKIKGLREQGRTALGPAMTIAQGMASFSEGPAKVLVFTDGYANVGLGSLENTSEKDITEFYTNVINMGKTWSISVSLVSFDDCGLATILGRVPEETGGILDKIKPTQLSECLSQELNVDIIATHAAIHFIVHKDMYVKLQGRDEKESKYNYYIGNIRPEKKIPFNFAVRPNDVQNKNAEKSTPQGQTEKPRSSEATAAQHSRDANSGNGTARVNEFPFQVQIVYKDLNGVEGRRVWTKAMPLTKERLVAEQTINPSVVNGSFLQTTAKELLDANEKDVCDISQRLIHTIQNHIAQSLERRDDQYDDLVKLGGVVTGITTSGMISDDIAKVLHDLSQGNRCDTWCWSLNNAV